MSIGLFEHLAADDTERQSAQRRAVIASTHRVTDKFGAFLANANSDKEKFNRFMLAANDIYNIVDEASTEFGADNVRVRSAITDHFCPSNTGNVRSSSVKEAIRRPKLCPYHKQIVDISLAQGEPKAGYEAMAQHSWSKQHCESDEYGGEKCKFRPEMTTKSYWEDRSQRNKEKKEERERVHQEQDLAPEISDGPTEAIEDSTPTEVSDGDTTGPEPSLEHDLESAPSAIASPEHDAKVAQGLGIMDPTNPAQLQGLYQQQNQPPGAPPIIPPQGQAPGTAPVLPPQGSPAQNPAGSQALPGVTPGGAPLAGPTPAMQQAQQLLQQNQARPPAPSSTPTPGPTSPGTGLQNLINQQQQFAAVHTSAYSVEQLSDGSGRWKVVDGNGNSKGVYDTQQEAQAEANQLNRGVSNQNQAELAPINQTNSRVADNNETGLGGPSPEIDKRKWTPENLQKRVETEGPDSKHPTKEIDIQTPLPANRSEDFLEGTRSQTTTEDLNDSLSSSGFAPNNMAKGPKTQTFPGTGQVNPVTRQTQSSDENPLLKYFDPEVDPEGFLSQVELSSALSKYNES